MYAQFDLDIPDNLDGALEALAGGGGVVPLAGGTNLIVDIRARRERPERVVGLAKVAELCGIKTNGGRIAIGGRTTVSDLLASPDIATAAPSLIEASKVFAGQMVRNTATVAGNIACGSPAADLVPPLMSLDADVTLTSKSGSRTVALDEYFLGYKQDTRRADELITEISWPGL
jgi:CO/xanthine dehydrogenase FAD-binding subunit